MALPAGFAPASIRLEDECLLYFGHGSVADWILGLVDNWIDVRELNLFNPPIQQSIHPSIHSENGQRGRICTCDPSVPNRVRWLLRYAPIALTAVSSGQEKRRTLTLARSCGEI